MPTKQFTIGVIYKTRGQTKFADMLQNEPTPQYLKFVDSLGQKIPLKKWTKFCDNLDTASDKEGEFSVYSTFEDYEFIFHSYSNIPGTRRRMIISKPHVIIVFDESQSPFDPFCVDSTQTYSIFVIRPVENSYVMAVVNRPQIPYIGPPIPDRFVIDESTKPWFYTKLINSYRACLSQPTFWKETLKLKFSLLEEIFFSVSSRDPKDKKKKNKDKNSLNREKNSLKDKERKKFVIKGEKFIERQRKKKFCRIQTQICQ